MCIYCGTDKYRKIYENHHGPIPKDEAGRSYHIHHIDRDRSNNHPDNLIALSIEEHFNIHLMHQDLNACLKLAAMMKMSAEEMSEIGRQSALKKIADGTHPFLGGEVQTKSNNDRVANGTHPWVTRPDGTSYQQDRVAAGEHQYLRREDGSSYTKDRVAAGEHQWLMRPDGSSSSGDRVLNGTHNFLTRNDGSSLSADRVMAGEHQWLRRPDGSSVASDRIAAGTHPCVEPWVCENCGEHGKGKQNYKKWHGDKCGILDPLRRVTINGITYASIRQASARLGISRFIAEKLAKAEK